MAGEATALDMGAGRGEAVAQAVQVDPLEPCHFPQGLARLVDPDERPSRNHARADRIAGVGGGSLRRRQRTERVSADRPPLGAGLGVAERDQPAVEVDIAPAQALPLAATLEQGVAEDL